MGRVALLLLLAVISVGVYVALPQAPRVLPPSPAGFKPPVRGVVHVHTRRSDGTGTVNDVAAAASRAGLAFVVITDHGDATRAPDLPIYREGVLCIDAVEISTDGGHVVALGLPRSPYPLGGEPRDVVEDIARMGGMSVVAHPGSEKTELRWFEWSAPFDGLEWLNGDSEWRDESNWTLARVLLAYPFRPAGSLALMLDRPAQLMHRWDVLTRRRRVVAIAGSDAHARIGLRSLGEPYDSTTSLRAPGYGSSFRTFSIALPQAALTGDPESDARTVLDEIRNGHVYSVIDAVAGPAVFAFTAESGLQRATGGDALTIDGPVALRVDVQAPADAAISLLRDGKKAVTTSVPTLRYVAEPKPAVFRVEVLLPGAPGTPPVPWIVSNPIYVGRPRREPEPPPAHGPAKSFALLYGDGPAPSWRIEHSDHSQGAIDVVPAVGGTQLLFRYALSGAASTSPFAALATSAGSIAGFDRLTFSGHSDHPVRLSVQLRTDGDRGAHRWHRSVYLDPTPRAVTIFFDDMRPRGTTLRPGVPLDQVQSILFVVDTGNTKSGTSGQVWLDDIKYER
jgi:hypothetical protein